MFFRLFGLLRQNGEYACFHSIVETAKRNGVSKFETLFRLVSDMAPKDDFIGKLLSEND